ncbi:hypothetical protein NMG60_11030371 [Bertholletia excelsa]
MAAVSRSFPAPVTSTRPSQHEPERPEQIPSFSTRNLRPKSLHRPWLGAPKLLLSSLRRTQQPKLRPINATVLLSLPTAKPERVSSTENVPKWSSKAIKSFAMAELEARKLKYPNTGTEALIMGILIEGTNLAAKFLMANGITLSKVREEIVKLLGKGDMWYFSPEHPPLTEAAQRALDWALDQKLKSSETGEILTTHLLLGVWSERDSPGHKVLAALGFNEEKAKELEALIAKPELVEE